MEKKTGGGRRLSPKQTNAPTAFYSPKRCNPSFYFFFFFLFFSLSHRVLCVPSNNKGILFFWIAQTSSLTNNLPTLFGVEPANKSSFQPADHPSFIGWNPILSCLSHFNAHARSLEWMASGRHILFQSDSTRLRRRKWHCAPPVIVNNKKKSRSG